MAGRFSGLLFAIGATSWIVVGLPYALALVHAHDRPRIPLWLLAWMLPFAIYGTVQLLVVLKARPARRVHCLLIGLQSLLVVAMGAIHDNLAIGTLLVPVALHAALVLGTRAALIGVALQSVALRLALWPSIDDFQCWLFWGLGVAFQVIGVGAVHVLRREAETAEALQRVNTELQAAQALLAGTAAHAERLRIARDLHDAWGHDLTALNLQLEYASHILPEPGRSSVTQARDLAKALLAKVRDVVGTLRIEAGHDARTALQALAASAPRLAVHLEVPDALAFQQAETLQAVVRSAQEIITNTLRHAGARNLWLALDLDQGAVRLRSRDDGDGADQLSPGHGLTGLRERFEQLGGGVTIETARGRGFSVAGWFPLRPGSS